MKRIVSGLLFLLVSWWSLGAQGANLAFRNDIDVARAIAGYVMAGKVPNTNGFVFSGNELAETLDYSGRTGQSTGLTSRLIFSINPAVTGVTGINIYTPAPYSDPTLLYFLDTLPVFTELGADFAVRNALAGRIKLDLAVRQTYVGENDIALYAPWDINSLLRVLLSWRFPQEGWISAGDANAWIAAGRFKAGLGDGHFGNTFLNSRAEWYDQVHAVVGNESFRFTTMVGSSSSHLYKTEAEIQFRTRDPEKINLVENSINPWDPINDHDFTTEIAAVKMFAYSQIEVRPIDSFRFGIAQMNMIGGKYPSLSDVLPAVFWHNTYTAGFNNVMLNLNAALVPLKGLQVFGEFTVDDFQGTDEGPEGKPSQYAWQLGARYSFQPVQDLVITAGGEYSLASEWIYCRWQPYLAMYQRHLINGSQGTDWPLGFTWGPDSSHIGIFANASLASGANLELGYEYLVKGPIYMGMMDGNGNPVYYDYDMRTDIIKDSTLATIRARPDQHSHGISLKVMYPLPRRFEANASLQYWNHTNFMNVANAARQFFLGSVGVRWKY
jgi:hypothetical protein